MKRSLGLGLLGAVLAVTALPALAQPGPQRGGPGPLMRQADADHDGRITETEGLNFLSARFAEADANKDGGVTRAELDHALRARWEANRPADAPARPMHNLQQRADAMFRAADANRDGRLTMEEVQPLAMALFRAADRDGNGVLETAELRGRHHHRGGGRPAPQPERAPPAPVTPG
ncbi:hypothetical protein E0493_21905 [Roseomonas sp. M0104]|uniref:EF-hand domain-containing protein n=1 Tax=Teichococcus coralli TaxID=2545983 RepID=A0A845BIV7_9PROT|nr:EF-hand domain-containing protein [Pseudoroseomonas coralli]MXP66004.1 hypothetical protein [Pseudoroseomonas coralli]